MSDPNKTRRNFVNPNTTCITGLKTSSDDSFCENLTQSINQQNCKIARNPCCVPSTSQRNSSNCFLIQNSSKNRNTNCGSKHRNPNFTSAPTENSRGLDSTGLIFQPCRANLNITSNRQIEIGRRSNEIFDKMHGPSHNSTAKKVYTDAKNEDKPHNNTNTTDPQKADNSENGHNCSTGAGGPGFYNFSSHNSVNNNNDQGPSAPSVNMIQAPRTFVNNSASNVEYLSARKKSTCLRGNEQFDAGNSIFGSASTIQSPSGTNKNLTLFCPQRTSSPICVVPRNNDDIDNINEKNNSFTGATSFGTITSEQSLSQMKCVAKSNSDIDAGATSSKCAESCVDLKECSHHSHSSANGISPNLQLTTEHYQRELQRCRDEAALSGGDMAKINGQMNEIFVKRLQDIDYKADGDNDLRLVTYQEWVDMLLKINESIIKNMEALEAEVSGRLDMLQKKINCTPNTNNELSYCQKDIQALLQVIYNGYRKNNWNLDGLHFETLSPSQILSGNEEEMSLEQEAAQKKLLTKGYCLEVEVGDDEISNLNIQLISLEDQIKIAQKNFQLKENIMELRTDIKCASVKIFAPSSVSFTKMPPINLEHDSSNTPLTTTTMHSSKTLDGISLMQKRLTVDSQFDTLSHNDQLEFCKVKALEDEFNELFKMCNESKQQKLDLQRQRLFGIFQRLEAEKTKAYKKLDFLRLQLIDLESSNIDTKSLNDCDSGISSSVDNDPDIKIIDLLRKRLRKLNDTCFELEKKLQNYELENNDIKLSLETATGISKRNGEILKEIADLLSTLSDLQLSYNDIYCVGCQPNPFCQAIVNLRKCYIEAEEKLLQEMSEYTKKNDSLKCQIQFLQHIIYEKEQQVTKLNTTLMRISHMRCAQNHEFSNCCATSSQEVIQIRTALDQANHKVVKLMEELEQSQKQELFLLTETRKLNDELIESKRKKCELNNQLRRLSSMLKTQETLRIDITHKFETMEKDYEEQSRKLWSANAKMNSLQERFSQIEKLNDEHNMERQLLRDEVLALKEKEAILVGRHKCVQDQLNKTERELFKAHGVINEQQFILQQNDSTHAENIKILNDTINDLKKKFNAVVEDYQRLQLEYEKECDLHNQNERVIESFRKWKEAQLIADEATRASCKQYDEHIKLLLEEKQEFLEQYRCLQEDYNCIQREIDQIRKINGAALTVLNTSENSITGRIEVIRRTSRRISENSSSLREECGGYGDPMYLVYSTKE